MDKEGGGVMATMNQREMFRQMMRNRGWRLIDDALENGACQPGAKLVDELILPFTSRWTKVRDLASLGDDALDDWLDNNCEVIVDHTITVDSQRRQKVRFDLFGRSGGMTFGIDDGAIWIKPPDE